MESLTNLEAFKQQAINVFSEIKTLSESVSASASESFLLSAQEANTAFSETFLA